MQFVDIWVAMSHIYVPRSAKKMDFPSLENWISWTGWKRICKFEKRVAGELRFAGNGLKLPKLRSVKLLKPPQNRLLDEKLSSRLCSKWVGNTITS